MIDGAITSWALAASRVFKGSVLCSLFIIIYVNEIGFGIVSKTLKFTDDTKLSENVALDPYL